MPRASTLVAGVLALSVVVAAPAAASQVEGSFVAEINRDRAAAGLAPLGVYWDLVDDARAHSQVMLATDDLHHNPDLASVTTGWSRLGENVGVGPSVASLHQAFMDSPPHRANVLGDFDYVGVGVAVETDSKMWVTVVFMAGPPGLATPSDHAESHQVGLVDPSQGQWHLLDEGGGVTSFFYGNPNDIPFMGDWDCDGDATPGLFRQSDAFAYLRNSNTEGTADIRFFFGNPDDIPIAGDWNGDGCDTLSLYRPSTQEFFIVNELGENEGSLRAADFSFTFGNPGDKPVVGDWDGDGIDEVGLHRESTGFFYWANTLSTGIADGEIFFGDPGDRFVSGDWGIEDGVDIPAVFRPSATTFFFRHTLTQGVADSQFVFGESGWLPVSGDFGLD